MPNWAFHNRYAKAMGIEPQVSNWVNMREDLPQFEHSNDKRLEEFRKTIPDGQPIYLEMQEKGDEYLRAWILHVLIDEIENICEELQDDNSYTQGTDLYEEAGNEFLDNSLLRLIPDDITLFILKHLEEIIKELPLPTFHMKRAMFLTNMPV